MFLVYPKVFSKAPSKLAPSRLFPTIQFPNQGVHLQFSLAKKTKIMWKILSSQTTGFGYTSNTLKRQKQEIKDVWNGKVYPNFGIERLVMLLLVILPFTDIALYLRNIFIGKGKLLYRKLFIDFYVLLNVLFPFLVLLFRWYDTWWVVVLCVYLGIETMIALLSMTFLSKNIPSAISYNRNLLSLFLNFIQMVFLFALLYMCCGNGFKDLEGISSLQAIYLSLETFTTVGYGDIVPDSRCAYIILIAQMLVQLIFVYFLFSIFTSKIGNDTFFNRQKVKKKPNDNSAGK